MTDREERFLREHFRAEAEYRTAVSRLEAGEPLAYIIGEWYFWRQTYRVSPNVLIPRSDTELLVEKLTCILPENGRFLDLCTGSGCIAISSLCERPDASADAVELYGGAAEIARLNSADNGVSDRLRIVQANAMSNGCVERLRLVNGLTEKIYDIIVSNPPYIRTDVIDTLSEQVKREPRAALDGGKTGMDFYDIFLSVYPPLLKDGGAFLFEIGYDQADCIRAVASARGAKTCDIYKDYGGNDRVALIRF